MYYNKEHLGDRATRMQKAIQLLQKAIETDANSGSAWYLIGRLVKMIVSPLFLANRIFLSKGCK